MTLAELQKVVVPLARASLTSVERSGLHQVRVVVDDTVQQNFWGLNHRNLCLCLYASAMQSKSSPHHENFKLPQDDSD
jgi:hypothetical protein